jgi:Na+-transporting NADH:ubiquinone oxidoreductase subunit NqrE
MRAASTGVTKPGGNPQAYFTDGLSRWLRRNFYFAMALVIAAAVIFGFSRTFANDLLYPPYPRPWILYVHATLFVLWVLLFLTQTALVRARSVKLHRRIGTFGLLLGTFLPIVAIATAVIMDRLHIAHHEQDDFFPPFFIVHLNDMSSFLVIFALAAINRTKPELHRRLMFVATCVLTDAAFDRFPQFRDSHPAMALGIAYVGVDLLILCGVTRDWIVDKSVHAVYRYVLPSLVAAQVLTTALFATAPPWWLAISHALIGA